MIRLPIEYKTPNSSGFKRYVTTLVRELRNANEIPQNATVDTVLNSMNAPQLEKMLNHYKTFKNINI